MLAVSSGPLTCDTGTGPGDPPRPTIISISPDTLLSESPATILTVLGRDFVPATRVRIDGSDRATAWHSATTLTTSVAESDLATPGAHEVTAYTPEPGGGTSGGIELTIAALVPEVQELQPRDALAGHADLAVAVVGKGFGTQVVVRWDGVDRRTARISSTLVQVSIGWADLALAGRHLVTVHNQRAAGDSSQGREFVVWNDQPVVRSVTPLHATAGQPDFTLTVDGERFAPGATLDWNGSPRITTFVGPGRVMAQIPAADVVQAGPVTIRVRNAAPAYGPSNDVAFYVEPPGRHVLAFEVGDLAWDPVRGRLYASIRTTDTTYPNRVIALDPMTGDVVQSVVVGSDPVRLAISDDASVLYVALDGAAAIRRVDLATFTAGAQFPVGWFQNRVAYADDIAVMPGRPGTVAVTLQIHGYSEGHIGRVVVYDSGVPRNVAGDGGTVIEFAGPDTLYGFGAWSSSFSFSRMLVADSGVVVDTAASGLMWGFGSDFAYLNGRSFGTDGSVIDAARMASLGSVAAGGTVAPDAPTEHVFYMWENRLSTVNAQTLALVGTEIIAGVPALDQPSWFAPKLLRWGVDGFAYRTFDKLVVFRSALALP